MQSTFVPPFENKADDEDVLDTFLAATPLSEHKVRLKVTFMGKGKPILKGETEMEPELKLLTGGEINLSLEERWTLVENVADTLYRLMHEVNVETAALTHLDLATGDLHTLRYLVHRVWEHYHKLADDLFKCVS